MKIIVACGGTGGHSFPGIAVAEELAKRGHEVIVWSSGRAIESSVMKRWQGEIFATGARQLRLGNALHILRSIFRCRRKMKATKPDALLAMGSYSSLPPVIAAYFLNVPVYLHEANTVPGKAVDKLSNFAKTIAISFEATAGYLPNRKTVLTGLPVRADIVSGKRLEEIPQNAFTIFVTGGSQGAHAVNELTSKAIVEMKQKLAERNDGEKRPLYVIHQTGVDDEATILGTYAATGVHARVNAFEHEMANAFASADLVIARAGASTCFELAACGKASMLIPLPTAMRDHQRLNAEAFAYCGAADVGDQNKLTSEQLCRYLLDRYDHPGKLKAMEEKIRALSVPDAAKRVADLVTGVD